LFENLAAQGFVDSRITEHEQRTYFKKRKLGYQLDHVFTDAVTADAVTGWTVLTDAAAELGLSDHAPIKVEIG
jgi:exonuclease III